MSILTEEEMRLIAGPRVDYFDHGVFGRAVEKAVLAKLAGMELPEPDDRFVFAGLDWHRATPEYFKQSQGQTSCIAAYSAAQLHQAYAQGAASQLSAVPAMSVSESLLMSKSEKATHNEKHGGFYKTVLLYTLKEPK